VVVGLTATEFLNSTGGLLVADCTPSPVPIRSYKKQIATLSLYDNTKHHIGEVALANIRGINMHTTRGTLCITHKGKPLLTLEFLR
jgi:hypothetical protein